MMSLAVVWGLGSIILFAFVPLGTAAPQLRLSDPAIVAWDTALSLLFFIQHSGMVRRSFRARLARHTPPEWGAAIYAIASGVALALVACLWQRSSTNLLVLTGHWCLVSWFATGAAVVCFGLGIRALESFDMLGLRPIRAALKGEPDSPPSFVVRGPYRWVRHPLYSSIILLIWANPTVTTDHLLFCALWTTWIVLGAWLEERDLTAEFGNAYRDYQKSVPFLVPWRGPAWAPCRGQNWTDS